MVWMLILPYNWRRPSPPPPPPASPYGPTPLDKYTPRGSLSAPSASHSQLPSLMQDEHNDKQWPSSLPLLPALKVSPPSRPMEEDNPNGDEDFHQTMGRQSISPPPPPPPLMKIPTSSDNRSPDYGRPSRPPPPAPRVSPPIHPIAHLDQKSPPPTAAGFYVSSY